MTFYQWLVKLDYRPDDIGAIARYVSDDPCFPRDATPGDQERHLKDVHLAPPTTILAFRIAYSEWLNA